MLRASLGRTAWGLRSTSARPPTAGGRIRRMARTRTRARTGTRRRRRRTSPSSRSRRPNAGAALVVLLVLVGLWWVGSDILNRAGPNAGKRLPRLPTLTTTPRVTSGGGTHSHETPAANVKTIQRLGGKVDYGKIDPHSGQRSGIAATITPAMVKAADQDQLGSEADPAIHPPGWDQLPSRNRARGHLLGRQLGGAGENPANLVTLYQLRANSPVMRDYESMLADAVAAGQTVNYQVQPLYTSPTDNGPPRAVRLRAQGNRGFRFDVEIANTPQATVKEYIPPTQTP